jgi:amino acid adenylation domain-containing protein
VPLQVILDPGPISLPEVDLRELALEHQSASATALLDDLGGLPFHLEHGEGWRTALVRLGPNEHELLFALSTVCADPGAFEPLSADLLAAYARQVTGMGLDPEPPLQVADVAEWQNSLLEGEDAAEGLEIWREHWKEHDISACIALPLPLQEREATPGTFAPREEVVPLARATAGALARLAGAWGCTPQVLLLTAWKTVIQRGTGRDESLVGVLYLGRDAEELRGVVGPLARYLPIAARFNTESSLREAVSQVQQAMKKAESWGEYFSWEHVAGNGCEAGGFPICFEAGLKTWTQVVDGLRYVSVGRFANNAALDRFSLSLSWSGEEENLRLALRYDPRHFRREAVRCLAERLTALLSSVAALPDSPLTDHPPMFEDELSRWLHLSATPPAEDRERGGKTLHAAFEEQADRTPDRIAVVAGDSHLTFRELDVRANRLAHHLRAAGADPEVVVAICLERSAEAVVTLLAVWKAGAPYVPLDPAQPFERLVWLLENMKTPLLVTDSRLASGLPGAEQLPGLRTVRLDEEALAITLQPAGRPISEAGPHHLAYVIYTSGSTGRPKGVLVEHRSALHLLAALEAGVLDPLAESGLLPEPLLASLNAPMIFDASVQQLTLLLAGHALCVVPQDVRADGRALLAFLRENGVDLLDCTPSQLRLLVEEGLLDDTASPRIVLTAGEAVDESLWGRLAQAEWTLCFNLYGPTECSVDATFHRIQPNATKPTIGRPLAGYEVFLLDYTLRPVPTEAPGEMCLGGSGLARGYLLRPDLTAEHFVPHPFATRPGERLYRTGDLGRHLSNGNLEFLGRLDHQVKIRGFRIELGEIETILAEQAGVREAVVVAYESTAEDRRLVAYVAGDASADTLRQALRHRLPDYMVPAAFVTLAALPLTTNGKVDRKTLPTPAGHDGEEEYLAPRTPVEEIISGIWAELLGVERVGAAGHFFNLGGHSLLATQVTSRVRSAFDIEISLRELFEAPTLAEFAARIEAAQRAGASPLSPPLVPVRREGPLPLSFAQQRLWFIDQLEPGSFLYKIPAALRVEGPLHVGVLALCLGEIVRRHEVLRTVFASLDGSPVQVIQPTEPFRLTVVDLSGLPERKREALVLTLTDEEAARPFDLSRDPLLRGLLLCLAERDHVVSLTMHHIASDGWSMGILIREVATLYPAFAAHQPSPLPELTVKYADFAVWQHSWLQGEVLENEISFWRRELAGLPPLLELSTDRPRPAVQNYRGAARPMRLPPALTQQFQTLGRREGATLFMVLLAGFQAILERYSSQQDLAVGSPVAGRNRMEIEGLIGFFVNTLVLRGDLAGKPSFREFLGRVRETALAAYLHQDVPFEKLVEELSPERSLAHSPLFQVMLVLQNAPAEPLAIRDLHLRPMSIEEMTSKFDLTVSLWEHSDGLTGIVEYATDLYDATTVDRLIGHFERQLTGMAERPEDLLGDLILLTAEEALQLRAWNETTTAYPLDRPLHAWIENQAESSPEAVALVFEEEEITYRELDRRANRLARQLRARGCTLESRVGVLLQRSCELLVALLAILKAGAAYVPLDPEHPTDRLAFQDRNARLQLILTRSDLAGRLPGAESRFLFLEHGGPEAGHLATNPLSVPIDPDHPAYVLFTSGSTGWPKGAVITHRAITNRLLWMQEALCLTSADRVLQKTLFSFDVSIWELFWPLMTGARLVLARPDGHRDNAYLVSLIVRQRITVLHFVPPMLQHFLEEPGVEECHTLRNVVCSGEALPAELARRFAVRLGHARLHNLYGPTEAAVDVTSWVCEAEGTGDGCGSTPIGRPIANTRIHLLDPGLLPVPVGVPGELFIAGVNLARGYVERPDLTAERFLPDPMWREPGERIYRTGDLARWRRDGAIEFLGRTDHQVKIRGFRIELGEIEAVLGGLPGVREAVVVAREDRPGSGSADRRLVAYVAGDATADALRQALRERLPEHMVPAAFTMLAALPLTPNGKVDRKALPVPDAQRSDEIHVAPRTPVEEILAGIWSEVLGLERVEVADHFFDLGGHSLLATRVMSRLRAAFGIEMPLRDLFAAPRLAELAARVEAIQRSGTIPSAPALLPVPREGPLPLSFAQQRLWFIDQLEPNSLLYNIPAALRVEGPLRAEVLALCLGEIVRRHESLRTVFLSKEGSPVQVIQPAHPFQLAVVDLSGLSEKVREPSALTLAAEEAARPFDLGLGPLLRSMLLRLADDDHIALLTMHHIVSDGWSMGILIREVTALYAAFAENRSSPLPELPVQYVDFAVWQRGWLDQKVLEQQIAWWRRQLSALPPLLELPTDRQRPAAQSFRGAARPVRLPAGLTRQMEALARREGATLFMVLLAGFQTLLARYSDQNDFAVGSPIAGRDRVEIEGLIGFFVNTLVLRGDFAGTLTFREFLGRVRETVLTAWMRQDVPFEKLVQELAPERSLAHTPLFQVMLVLQNAPAESLEIRDLRLRPVSVKGTAARFDLTVNLSGHYDGLVGTVEYATDLFDGTTAHRLIGHFERLLAEALAMPESEVSKLPLLFPAERHQLLTEWNDTAVPRSRGILLQELFEAQAACTPDSPAAVFQGETLTYAVLDSRADRLARRLRGLGCGRESRVAVALERSLDLIVTLLGVLKAGAAYVPLDPDYPRERLVFVLEDAAPWVLITETHLRAALPTAFGAVLYIDREPLADSTSGRGHDAPIPGDDRQLAYVLYTSGSTGRPKGVGVSHQALVNFLRSMSRTPGFSPGERLLAVTSLSFDIAALEIFLPLIVGGCVELASRAESADGTLLAARLRASEAGVLQATPATWRMLLDSGWTGDPALRALCGGEALSPDLAASLAGRTREFWNLYGPTETTVWSTTMRIRPEEEGPVSIGSPIADTQIHLLDRHLQTVPLGVPGELWIAGAGLSRGYLGRPDLTAVSFLPNPLAAAGTTGERLYRTGDLARHLPGGRLEVLGRTDHQVKIRGFRIELGEIEAVLGGLPGVREAVVVARENRPGSGSADRRLVAYVAGDATADALRQALRERLPEHMVPAAFTMLAALPLTPNGKVDRKALPVPDAQRSDEIHVAPRTPVEEILAGIWSEVLGLERVEVADHFFDLGGHSLLATRVMSRLRAAFGIEMPLRDLFAAPRLAELAARVEAIQRSGTIPSAPALLPVPREGPLPLSFAQQRLWFIDQLEPNSLLYNIPAALRVEGPLRAEVLALCLGEIVRRHESLRTVFLSKEGSPVQVIQPAHPFQLAVVDLSGLSEKVREPSALTLAAEEAARPFDLGLGPLLRSMLLRLADDDHIALLTMHHIVSDGWSMGILIREVTALYAAFAENRSSPLPELPVQYVDFAVWQRGWLDQKVLESLTEYWRRRLAEAPSLLDLPGAKPRPAALSSRGAACQRRFAAPLLEQLRDLGRRESATLFMALMAPLQALIHSWTGVANLVIGTDVAGRDRQETEGLIGFFINQLPLYADLTGDPTLRELLRRVRETALEAYTYQNLPFDHLVEALRAQRSLQHSPVFQVKLVLQNIPQESLDLEGLTLELMPLSTETAQLDLHWNMAVIGETLWLDLTYSTDLYDEPLIDRLLDQYEVWLRAFAERPEVRLSELVVEIAQAARARRAERGLELKSVGRRKLQGLSRRGTEVMETEP